jgi:hypothetical protein
VLMLTDPKKVTRSSLGKELSTPGVGRSLCTKEQSCPRKKAWRTFDILFLTACLLRKAMEREA